MVRFPRSSLKLTFAFAISSSTPAFAQENPPTAAEPAPAAAEPAPAAAEPAPVATEPAPVVTSEPAPIATAEPAPAPAAAKPKPPPYSLPWQLRPVVAGSVVRSDTAWAFFKDAAGKESGASVASMLLFSYKVTDAIAPMIRLGVASMRPPRNYGVNMQDVDSATNFLNPVLGVTYAMKPAKPLRLAFFLGVTLPIGSGGGDDAKLNNIQANSPFGIRTRSAMDNAMFSPNDFTILPGVDFAYVSHGFTVQVEATLLQLMRVKGDGGPAPKNPDSSKTNLTMGLHVGYFFIPQLSVGAELRHQRFVSTPAAVKADEAAATPIGLRDQTTWAIGPRAHFKLGESIWFRPGVAFSMPIDDPMSKFEYKVVQLDLPVAF
ncbi:MAG: putative secreted protein [Polyangiaceae bacterium]|jgi:hypothetical protein|nr:putative secreted protein [Polyangiaceae bacterium]